MEKYKAITLLRPWAEFVVSGLKVVENRMWPTKHRGLLVIHAGKGYDYDWTEKLPQGVAMACMLYLKGQNTTAELTPTGLVGVVTVVDCTEEVKDPRWHQDGMYGWYLKDARRFKKAVPYSGKQGFWDVLKSDIDRALTQ